MRTIDSHDGPDRRINEPAGCPGCGAKKTRRDDDPRDSMAIDISFECGARVKWRSAVARGGGSYCESITAIAECRKSLADMLGAAMAAHPCLRMGQLVWTAAYLAREQAELRCCEIDAANVFYIGDEALAEGLDMVRRKSSLPGDEATQLAERIKSYLARKVGAALDGETVDHVARIIRGDL